MKKITNILKRALKKSANNIIKEDSTHGNNMQHSNCTTPSRAPNTFPGNPGGAQCAGKIRAIRCSTMPSGWDVLVDGDPCNQPGASCHTDNNHIKVFPPGVNMSSPFSTPQDNSCHGGYTPVVGDYILSSAGTGGGNMIGWQVVEVIATQDKCQGPRRNHPACVSTLNIGCTDPNASNFNTIATQDCNGDAPGTNNPGWDSCCTYPSNIPGCTDPTAINYNPNATIDDGSCMYPSFDCISGNCEENISLTSPGVHATLNDCLVSQDCDRWECKTSADPGAMEEQIAPQPTISNCVKCDVNRYDIVNEMWDPLCQYFDKQECDEECTPVETPVDPCEDFVLGTFQGVNPCCELCGTDGSGGWNTSTYVGPMTHPNLPQCWYTCQCCTMPVNCSGNNPAGECFVCHHDVNSNQPPSSCAQLSSFPSNWWQSVGMPQGFNAYNTEADCLAAGVGCIDATSPVGKDIECMQCDSGGAPVANMFPGPLCPAGWTPAQQFNPSSCKQPAKTAKMIEPTKDVRDIEVPLNEGLQLKGELLNKSRMTKLANINKK